MSKKSSIKRPSYVCKPKYALRKARNGVKLNPWELEKVAESSHYSVEYAIHILNGRFVEAEQNISQCGRDSLSYAIWVIKGPWPMGEAAIAESADTSITYARDVLKSRFHMGERNILGSLSSSILYAKSVIKGRWPELEKKILSMKTKTKREWWSYNDFDNEVSKYLKIVGERWPEYEEHLLAGKRARPIYNYAKYVGGRLPDALHQKMMMFSFDPKRSKASKMYIKYLEHCERMVLRYISGLSEEARIEFSKKICTN